MAKAKPATSSVIEIKNYPASLIRNHSPKIEMSLALFRSNGMTDGVLA